MPRPAAREPPTATRSGRSSPGARGRTTGSRSTSPGPIPGSSCAAADRLPDSAWAELAAELERIDRATKRGPWTIATLRLIGDRPEVAAADLAAAVGRERLPFKADVRRLKELGLTESLRPGYRLSPRGAGLLDYLSRRATSSPSGRGRSAARG